MATNLGNGYHEEGGGRSMAATMGMARRTQPLALQLERGGMMVAMGHGLCVCFGVCGETTKNKEEGKIVAMFMCCITLCTTGYVER